MLTESHFELSRFVDSCETVSGSEFHRTPKWIFTTEIELFLRRSV